MGAIMWSVGCQSGPEIPGGAEIENSASSPQVTIDATRITPTELISIEPTTAEGGTQTIADTTLAGAMGASPEAAAALTAQREEWRKTMSRKPLPKKGCFRASDLSTTWDEVPCATPPAIPFVPAGGASAVGPRLIGGGAGDFSSAVSGTISWSEGSFPVVNGLTTATPNNYSLQLNSNTFSTGLCSGRANCLGWQQFIYTTAALGSSQIFMQHWLINYGIGCPQGWTQQPGGSSNCFINSNGMPVPFQPITNLRNLILTGAAGSTDMVSMSTGDGKLYAVSQNTALNLNNGWNVSEFNVFGDGRGSQVAFNNGTTIAVQTLTISSNGSTAKPSCQQSSSTGETNNLTIVPNSCYPMGGTEPGIWFTESVPQGVPAFPPPPVRMEVNGAILSRQPYSGAVDVTRPISSEVCKSGDCPVGFCYWTTLHGPFWALTTGDVSLNVSQGRGTSLAITTIPATATSPELWGVRYTGNVTDVPVAQAAPYVAGGTVECTAFNAIQTIPNPDTSCGSTRYSYADPSGFQASGSTSLPAVPSVPTLTGFIGNVAQAYSWHAPTGAPVLKPDSLNLFPGFSLISNRTPPGLQSPAVFPRPPFFLGGLKAEAWVHGCGSTWTPSYLAQNVKSTSDVQLISAAAAPYARCFITGIQGGWSRTRTPSGLNIQPRAAIYTGSGGDIRLSVWPTSPASVTFDASGDDRVSATASCIRLIP